MYKQQNHTREFCNELQSYLYSYFYFPLGETYNIGSDFEISVADLAKDLIKRVNVFSCIKLQGSSLTTVYNSKIKFFSLGYKTSIDFQHE